MLTIEFGADPNRTISLTDLPPRHLFVLPDQPTALYMKSDTQPGSSPDMVNVCELQFGTLLNLAPDQPTIPCRGRLYIDRGELAST